MRSYPILAVALAALPLGCWPGEKKVKSTNGTYIRVREDDRDRRESPPPPCHPGCFPAGTLVNTPDGPRPIDAIRTGDRVMRITPEGTAVAEAVHSTFCTTNVLVELRTDAGTLNTTPTQPLCLVTGEFRRAGELKPGDRIWTWVDGRKEVVVMEVIETRREVPVFNLVVGDSAVFVANGYLAKGKPPLEAEMK